MSNPTSDWDKVPISACYRLIGGGYDSGTVSFTLSQRITTADGSGLYARGQKITVSVSDSDGSLSLNFPASDDPDVSPNGWTIKVEENLKSKGGQVYYITPTLAAGSVNLNTVVVPDDAPSAPPPVYARGQAGGLAGLDSDGDVINAAGDKVTGTGADGADGVGVPTGGTTGQVLAKASATDYDTGWVDASSGGGSGTVESVVAGTGITVDDTDPANPVVSATGSSSGPREALFKLSGTLTASTGITRLYNDTGAAWTISSVRATVETAPSGGTVVIDVNIDGTTIFTTQANRPTIADGDSTSGKVTDMDVTSVADGSYLTIDVDTATSPAANLTVTLVIT